ncbi:MAG: T9SS type A sorting domain-containing protein [Chitinophagaceae bacterium]|nr:MAG: T9SS type A sorting domain-containing protein [Chitinophagaceae bacterium]
MKTLLPALLLMVLFSIDAHTQITTPVLRANFRCACRSPFQFQGRGSPALAGLTTLLRWKVRNNSFAGHFEIERSSDGKYLTLAGRMDMVSSSSLAGSYSFNKTLANDPSVVYYRVVLINKDGSRQASPAIQLSASSSEQLKIYPNPTTEWLQMQLTVNRASAAKISIYNAGGRLVYSTQTSLQKGNNQLKVPGLQGKPAGT